ncbi:hypothetical protein ACFS6H_19820 [Terrimonas rubra]|uniref:Uncharacterized protein n=1 Tax=Terrimonas rubra TaxID=1035890 RepID=A0ABW6ACR7_9BACT
MERTNILHEFFNAQSDNSKLETSSQETLENEFQQYMTNGEGELNAMDFVNEICLESLSPECFEQWVKVKEELKKNRRLFKKYNYV